MKICLKALAIVGGKEIDCHGHIEIHTKTDIQAYISWQLYDYENNSIAGISKNYFIANNNNSIQNIISLVIEDIKKYRMARKYIIREIKIPV